jgi:hypothetical protein
VAVSGNDPRVGTAPDAALLVVAAVRHIVPFSWLAGVIAARLVIEALDQLVTYASVTGSIRPPS